MTLLDNRVASPSEIADELGTPLSNTAYHVRQLAGLGLVELVSRKQRRGAVEHHYTAKVRPTIWDEVWAGLPLVVKRAMIGSGLQETIREITAAAGEGAFDRENFHFTRTEGRLDRKAWDAISRDLARMLTRFEKVVEESEARLQRDPHADAEDGLVVLMHFPRAPRRVLRDASPPVLKTPVKTVVPELD